MPRGMLTDLLKSGIGAGYKPEKLGYDEDELGNPINPQTGKILTSDELKQVSSGYYKRPSFAMGMFNPEMADYINRYNAQWQSMPDEANRAEIVQRGTIGNRLNTYDPKYWQFPDNKEASITAGQYEGLGPSALESGQTHIANINVGIPQTAAAAESERLNNLRRKYGFANIIGLPEAEVSNEFTGAQRGAEENIAQTGLIRPRTLLEQEQLKNEMTRQQGLERILPFSNQAGLYGAQRESALAGQGVSNLIYDISTLGQEAVNRATQEQFIQSQTTPFAFRAYGNPETGAISGTMEPNPFSYASMMMGRAQTNPGFIDSSTKQPIILPTQIRPPIGGTHINGTQQTNIPPNKQNTLKPVPNYSSYVYDNKGHVYYIGGDVPKDVTSRLSPDDNIMKEIKTQQQHERIAAQKSNSTGLAFGRSLGADIKDIGYTYNPMVRSLYKGWKEGIVPVWNYLGGD